MTEETLLVATALAPTVYSRNRMFTLFKEPKFAQARKRGQLVRSVAREWLKGARVPGFQTKWTEDAQGWELWYEVPSLHLTRTLRLSSLERVCVLYLLEKGKAEGIVLSREDRVVVERTLAKLVA